MKSLYGRLLPYPGLEKRALEKPGNIPWSEISLLISTFEPPVYQMLPPPWSRWTSSETHVAFPNTRPKAAWQSSPMALVLCCQSPWFWGCTECYEQGFDASQAHWEGGNNGSITYLRHLVKPNRKPVEGTLLTGNTVEEVHYCHWCINPALETRAELSLPSCLLWHLEHCLGLAVVLDVTKWIFFWRQPDAFLRSKWLWLSQECLSLDTETC